MEVYAIKFSERIEKSLFNRLLSGVSEDKQMRIKRFLNWQDAQRTLLGDILVRTLICERMKIKNRDISFVINPYGKPFLSGSDSFYFNISHSGEWVVCAVDHLHIGIDVEFIRPIEFSIAERFFSKEEHKDLLNKTTDSERLSYFYDLWTLKESYIKADGRGLSVPLDSFTIRAGREGIKIKTENEFRNCSFTQYPIDRKYKLSVCVTGNPASCDIVIMDVEDICRRFTDYNGWSYR